MYRNMRKASTQKLLVMKWPCSPITFFILMVIWKLLLASPDAITNEIKLMCPNCSFKTWIKKMLLLIDTPLNYSGFGRKLFMHSCWMLQTMGFHICKQKTIDNCTWNISLKVIEVHIFCYPFWIIAHILFNGLLQVLNRFSWPVLVTLWPRSRHNFERHNNNLSSVNYLMTTVKIERAFIHLRSHIHLYIIHMT
jgi:hypothetical protein